MLNISNSIDHVILFSGDGDFRRLAEAVQRKGVRVSVISSNSTQPSMISDDLRRQADQFIDLKRMRDVLGRGRPQGAAAGQPEADSYEDDGDYEYIDDEDYEDEEETV